LLPAIRIQKLQHDKFAAKLAKQRNVKPGQPTLSLMMPLKPRD